MRVIPVLDVRRGLAVHAVGGDRDHYRPVVSRLHGSADPVSLASGFRDVLGLESLYLADLDAIVGRVPPELALYRKLADLGLTLAVDAGVRVAADVAGLVEAGVGNVVVGLETIEGPEELSKIVDRLGPDRVVFSLDLRDGRPMVETSRTWGTEETSTIIDMVIKSGAHQILRLDLAWVGAGRGLGPVVPVTTTGVDWWLGGGVSGPSDLGLATEAGYSAVLVGSALHDGRIKAEDILMEGGVERGESPQRDFTGRRTS